MRARLGWLSLKTRLILTYLVVLAIGGLSTSLVGSWIVSSTIMAQARRSIDRLIATARALYDQQLADVQRTVALSAAGIEGREIGAEAYLEPIRRANGLDFLVVSKGADDTASLAPVKAALAGAAAAGTEDAREGMALVAAAPVRDRAGRVVSAVYGGVLLNRRGGVVQRAWELLFKGDQFRGKDVGAVAIYQGASCISTSLASAAGRPAAASPEAVRDVLKAGRKWRGRADLSGDTYISGFDPITDSSGRIIGMLSVGLLERAYTDTRDRVILSFFGIASVGFILIIAITYYEVRRITQPLGVMADATRGIAAGIFDQQVEEANCQGEIALLAGSFNLMAKSLRQMKGDLEEWGRTLEEKVRERTEQLAAMQARMAQSERLASVGMLAAGVAHEINNPLGGILSLTALCLEDLPADDPNRESLEVVLRQAERCRDIVRKLLEFSRQSAPRAELLDINRVLEETHSLIAKQAVFQNVQVVKEWAADLPPVSGDKSQLTQVFMNMMINAAQSMGERGTLTIITRSGAGAVEVDIRDTGCGIPQEQAGHVFDPFFTTKASGQGTGLGLSIAYGIVTAHKGSITVESAPRKGTTFTVRLPAA